MATVGTCERIKSTPCTFGYVSALRTFLILWLGTLPLVLIGEYGWVATPALAFISFLFLTVEQMAIEIEQPFGHDANDLPLEKYPLDPRCPIAHRPPPIPRSTSHGSPSGRYILDLQTTILQLLPGRSALEEGLLNDDHDRNGDRGDVVPGVPVTAKAIEHAKAIERAGGTGGGSKGGWLEDTAVTRPSSKASTYSSAAASLVSASQIEKAATEMAAATKPMAMDTVGKADAEAARMEAPASLEALTPVMHPVAVHAKKKVGPAACLLRHTLMSAPHSSPPPHSSPSQHHCPPSASPSHSQVEYELEPRLWADKKATAERGKEQAPGLDGAVHRTSIYDRNRGGESDSHGSSGEALRWSGTTVGLSNGPLPAVVPAGLGHPAGAAGQHVGIGGASMFGETRPPRPPSAVTDTRPNSRASGLQPSRPNSHGSNPLDSNIVARFDEVRSRLGEADIARLMPSTAAYLQQQHDRQLREQRLEAQQRQQQRLHTHPSGSELRPRADPDHRADAGAAGAPASGLDYEA